MPTAMVGTEVDRHAYPLKTPVQTHRRVKAVARQYGIAYNAALNLLLQEALDARKIPEDS
jgi:antitoxin component of RelBE/YafQ-DinJ toxin-antitoxin module